MNLGYMSIYGTGGGGGGFPQREAAPRSGGSSSSVSMPRHPPSSQWTQDTALPGTTEGPLAAEFQAALRESAALSSHERCVPEPHSEVLQRARRASAAVTVAASAGTGGGSGSGNAGATTTHTNDPPLLELTLPEVSGHLAALSRDQIGSRVVQAALEGASEEEIEAAFDELKPRLEVLMADQFGNYVVQRMLEAGVASVVGGVVEALHGRVLPFSLHVYGCRVVQKLLEVAPGEDKAAVATELLPYTLHCLGDQNANHVVQKCLETVQPTDDIIEIARVIADNSLTLARHSFGCRSVQRLLQHCSIDAIRSQVIEDTMGSILELTKNQFGNYVVQNLVASGPEDARNRIMAVITPLAASLACHKFASNVMETCLQHCPTHQREALIAELIHPSSIPRSSSTDVNANTATTTTASSGHKRAATTPSLSTVARDQYGNYVLQRALEMAGEEQQEQLVRALIPFLETLRRSGYGKHIAARVAKLASNLDNGDDDDGGDDDEKQGGGDGDGDAVEGVE